MCALGVWKKARVGACGERHGEREGQLQVDVEGWALRSMRAVGGSRL